MPVSALIDAAAAPSASSGRSPVARPAIVDTSIVDTSVIETSITDTAIADTATADSAIADTTIARAAPGGPAAVAGIGPVRLVCCALAIVDLTSMVLVLTNATGS